MLPVTNGAAEQLVGQMPYGINVTIEGVSPILLHAWNNESVEEKAKAVKGSKTKKTDDVESYVRRNDEGIICIPGEYLRQSLILASKSEQDPRSPRKSLMDLTKASIVCTDELCPIISSIESKEAYEWDYLDKRRVVIMRAAITRSRPAFKKGYKATFRFMVINPEYFGQELVYKLIENAGKFCGIGDYRPTNGRFIITHWEVEKAL